MSYQGDGDQYRRIAALSGSGADVNLRFRGNDLAFRDFETFEGTGRYAGLPVALNETTWNAFNTPTNPEISGTGWLWENSGTASQLEGADGDFLSFSGVPGSNFYFENTSGVARRIHLISTMTLQNSVASSETWAFGWQLGNADVGTSNELFNRQIQTTIGNIGFRFSITLQTLIDWPVADGTDATRIYLLGRRSSPTLAGPAGAMYLLNAQTMFRDA